MLPIKIIILSFMFILCESRMFVAFIKSMSINFLFTEYHDYYDFFVSENPNNQINNNGTIKFSTNKTYNNSETDGNGKTDDPKLNTIQMVFGQDETIKSLPKSNTTQMPRTEQETTNETLPPTSSTPTRKQKTLTTVEQTTKVTNGATPGQRPDPKKKPPLWLMFVFAIVGVACYIFACWRRYRVYKNKLQRPTQSRFSNRKHIKSNLFCSKK